MGILDYGWIYVERGAGNAFQLGCDKWFFDMSWLLRETVQDTAGDQHQGFDQQIIARGIVLKNVYFKTSTDFETFLDRALTMNAAGTVTIEIRKTTAAIPGSLFAFKSGVTSLEMLFEKCTNGQKISRGDDDVYMVSRLHLRQAG